VSDFQINIIDEIVVVKVDILIATHRDAKPLWDEFESKLLFNRKKVVIDLSFCNNVDSTFLGMLVKILRKLNERGGQLALVFPKLVKQELFIVTGINKIIPCYNTLAESLRGMGSKRPLQEFNLNSTISPN
jgi:anti-sigma B factor antagonist/stage II sporulation protein AA (anti-sigma F factor antagonist)